MPGTFSRVRHSIYRLCPISTAYSNRRRSYGGRLGDLINELKQHVATKFGLMARPDDIHFAAELPMTRSRKIMGRPLRDVADRVLGDTTTLADPDVVEALKTQYGGEE